MSFDNIQLSPLLLKDLYKNHLVDLNEEMPPLDNESSEKIPFLGRNDKHVVIIVNEPEHAFLADNDLNFLIGILSACKLSIADTAVVNIYKKNVSFNDINIQFTPSIILMFGIPPSQISLPLEFPHFQVQKYNSKTFLSSPSLSETAADVSLKKLLWPNLQKLFSIA